MKLKKMHWAGLISALIIIVLDVIFFLNNSRMLYFLMGIGLGTIALPFVISFTLENKKEQKINEMFLEFSRNLAESVATGTPINKSIANMKKKNYGELNPYIEKLSNQIELGVPINKALENFAEDINSPVVKRATALIREAEKAGGEIEEILDSTAKSVSEIEKLKRERKSAIYSLVVQGYIIFFIFIAIVIVVEFQILPLTVGTGGFANFNGDINNINPANANTKPSTINPEELTNPFIFLLLTQGFFVGLVIGKLTEGSIKAGLKHSFILMMTAFIVSNGAKLILSPVKV